MKDYELSCTTSAALKLALIACIPIGLWQLPALIRATSELVTALTGAL